MDKERSGERMRLGAFFHPTGNHVAAWLHPDAQIDAGTNFRHYAEITQTAERGKFDLMFVADAVAVRDGNRSADVIAGVGCGDDAYRPRGDRDDGGRNSAAVQALMIHAREAHPL